MECKNDILYQNIAPIADFSIVKKPRIGVDYAGEWAKKNLRFYIKDNPYISKK